VVADRQVQPVWLDCVVRPTHHHSHVVSVVVARVEVGVVPDEHRHSHFTILGVEKGTLFQVVGKRAFLSKDSLECLSKLESVALTGSREVIESLLTEVVVRSHGKERPVKESLKFELSQVDHGVANSRAADWLFGVWVDKDSEGNVLQRELSVLVIGDP